MQAAVVGSRPAAVYFSCCYGCRMFPLSRRRLFLHPSLTFARFPPSCRSTCDGRVKQARAHRWKHRHIDMIVSQSAWPVCVERFHCMLLHGVSTRGKIGADDICYVSLSVLSARHGVSLCVRLMHDAHPVQRTTVEAGIM